MGKILEKARRAFTTLLNLLQRPWALTFSLGDFRFLSDRETLLYLKEKGVGIARFGDGDLLNLNGASMIYQRYDPRLQRKLAEVLSGYTKDAKFLIALPLDLFFEGEQAYTRRGASPSRWRGKKYAALPFLKRGQVYGSPFCFKNINMTDEGKKQHVNMMRSLVENRDIIYIGNSENLKDVRNMAVPKESIFIPKADVFDSYGRLLKEAVRAAEKYTNPIVLIAASATATVLSAELNTKGILAYDIGVPFPRKKK